METAGPDGRLAERIDGDALLDDLGIDDAEVNWRKDFTGFDSDDAERLSNASTIAARTVANVSASAPSTATRASPIDIGFPALSIDQSVTRRRIVPSSKAKVARPIEAVTPPRLTDTSSICSGSVVCADASAAALPTPPSENVAVASIAPN